MQRGNQTSVSHFILVGLHHPPQLGPPLFLAFLLIYFLTVAGNGLIILTVLVDIRLHRPMYWFLCHLSFLDMTISSAIVPKMLAGFLLDSRVISYGGCVVQLFSFHFLGCTECFLYTLMAYDRFLAICKPLHYATIMTRSVCNSLAFGTWMGGTIHSLFQTSFIFRLPFCGPNRVDYFFCDIPAVLRLACADTTINEMVTFVDIGFLALTCFMLILTSYGYIVAAILRIRSADGRRNAFSTCAAHLTVVIVYYVPCTFIYLRPGSQEPLDGVVAVFYTVITPLLNPIIYTLRNKEMKAALRRLGTFKEMGLTPGHPNQTVVSRFFLEGLMYTAEHPGPFFLLFLLIYSITVSGNLLILVTVGSDPHLRSPMYHFLGHLSFLDACLSTVTVPKVMAGLLTREGKVISFLGCVLQLYCFHFLASTECFLYTVMAYDRYLAICQPLHYPVAMSRRLCACLAGAAWAVGVAHSATHTSLTFRLPYCGPRRVAYFFCDIPPVLKLACADTAINELAMLVNIGVVAAGCLVLIVASYACITAAVLRIRTARGRQRAFSTCTAHLTVVLLYYLPPVCIYLQPGSSDAGAGAPAVFYTIVTPMLNPFVYTLRNKEVKRALRRRLCLGSQETPPASPPA
ncbi:olfactory receptor 10S1-like [Ctenodactylus gundi]